MLETVPRRNPEPEKSETSTQEPQATRKPQDTFVAAVLDEPTEHQRRRSPLEWLLSVAVHFVVIAALIIVPLYFTQTLNVKAVQSIWLVAPPPPAPAPPPPPAIRVRSVKPEPHLVDTGKLTVPTSVPKHAVIFKEAAAPPPDTGAQGIVGGIPGGVGGGQPGGVLGGVLGGTGNAAVAIRAPAAPPPPVKRIVRIGGNLRPPKQIYSEAPVYPVIAKEAHVTGTVVIDAVIDEHGNVVQGRAVSGPGVLIPSALQTVLKWKYEPTYLNGQAVSVEMEVQVHFVLP